MTRMHAGEFVKCLAMTDKQFEDSSISEGAEKHFELETNQPVQTVVKQQKPVRP